MILHENYILALQKLKVSTKKEKLQKKKRGEKTKLSV